VLVRGGLLDLAKVRPPVPAVHPRREHQAVPLHHPPYAFAVVARPEGPVHYRPDTAIAAGRPAARHRPALPQNRRVRGPVIAPVRPRPSRVICGVPRDAEDTADGRHRVADHHPDSASAYRFSCGSHLGAMSRSRLSSATVFSPVTTRRTAAA